VLHAVLDPISWAYQTWNMIKPGGFLIIQTITAWRYCPSPMDLRRYTHSGLIHLLRSAIGTRSFTVRVNGYSMMTCVAGSYDTTSLHGKTSEGQRVIMIVEKTPMSYDVPMSINMNHTELRNQMDQDGLIVLEEAVSVENVNKVRQAVLEYVKAPGSKVFISSGWSIPDYIEEKDLQVARILIHDNPRVIQVLDILFGGRENYRSCLHNDIGVNRKVGWHKDRLNGPYSDFQHYDVWQSHRGYKHDIYKVLIYLEDHTKDDLALKWVPGSHKQLNVSTVNYRTSHPKLGDIIIFDQRLTHAGQFSDQPASKEHRILITAGFGRHNLYTNEFELGTKVRQKLQRRDMVPCIT
jgi:hypothetical protein